MMKLKKLYFVFALFVSFGSIQAQNETNENSNQDIWTYAELLGTRKLMSNKVTVEIDYGQENPLWKFTDDRIIDVKTGKPKTFNSMVDAMNFMGALGWEFVQAYVVTEGNQNVYHWLLKLRVKPDEKGNFIPLTKNAASKMGKKE